MPPGSRVVAAVSGGSDSVALLLLLLDVAGGCGFTVAGVAHVNHGLRGAASDRDEAFCRALAARLGVAFEARHRDVARLAADGRVSIEVAARHARYECLAEMAATLKADTIATGHTRDDQAETFLLRLLRGAGASGLSGIRPRRGRVVRPLLDIRRNELLAELAGRRQAYRTDSTNRDVSVPRNWVRHRLLPMLARQLNADIVEVLARDAAVLRDEAALLDGLTQETASRLTKTASDGAISLEAPSLAALASGAREAGRSRRRSTGWSPPGSAASTTSSRCWPSPGRTAAGPPPIFPASAWNEMAPALSYITGRPLPARHRRRSAPSWPCPAGRRFPNAVA